MYSTLTVKGVLSMKMPSAKSGYKPKYKYMVEHCRTINGKMLIKHWIMDSYSQARDYAHKELRSGLGGDIFKANSLIYTTASYREGVRKTKFSRVFGGRFEHVLVFRVELYQ